MKFKTLLSALLIFTAVSVFGQNSKQVETVAKAKTEKLQKALNLTSLQNQKVYRQVYTYQSRLERFNMVENKTAKNKEAMDYYTEKFDSNMKKILDDEQDAAFAKLMKKEKKTFRE